MNKKYTLYLDIFVLVFTGWFLNNDINAKYVFSTLLDVLIIFCVVNDLKREFLE